MQDALAYRDLAATTPARAGVAGDDPTLALADGGGRRPGDASTPPEELGEADADERADEEAEPGGPKHARHRLEQGLGDAGVPAGTVRGLRGGGFEAGVEAGESAGGGADAEGQVPELGEQRLFLAVAHLQSAIGAVGSAD